MRQCKNNIETDMIKERLNGYTAMLAHIDNQYERLEQLKSTLGSPSTPNLSGMPKGSDDFTSKVERQIMKKLELEGEIKEAIQQEQAEYRELTAMVEKMKKPNERLVIEMRYFNRESWEVIAQCLFGSKADYDDRLENYQRRTFSIHSAALITLAQIINT